MSEVKPALTAEEWAEVANTEWGRQVYANLNDHAAAAVALHGHEFGFTHEMVAAIRRTAEFSGPDADSDLANAAADRIAALLPPVAL